MQLRAGRTELRRPFRADARMSAWRMVTEPFGTNDIRAVTRTIRVPADNLAEARIVANRRFRPIVRGAATRAGPARARSTAGVHVPARIGSSSWVHGSRHGSIVRVTATGTRRTTWAFTYPVENPNLLINQAKRRRSGHERPSLCRYEMLMYPAAYRFLTCWTVVVNSSSSAAVSGFASLNDMYVTAIRTSPT